MDDDNYSPEYGMDLTSQGAGTYWLVHSPLPSLNHTCAAAASTLRVRRMHGWAISWLSLSLVAEGVR